MSTTFFEETRVEQLPDEVDRDLVYIEGRSGLLFKPYSPDIVANQVGFGSDASDIRAMYLAHSKQEINPSITILGIRERLRQRFILEGNNTKIDVVSRDPIISTTWIGEHTKIITPDEARRLDYAGRTAYQWAGGDKVNPEAVVKAINGLFYPASSRDTTLRIKT